MGRTVRQRMKEKEEPKQSDDLNWSDDQNLCWDELVREWNALAEEGDAQNQWKMAQVCIEGFTVEKDVQKAFRWWRKAAKQGHLHSQVTLATLYFCYEGFLRRRNLISAYAWYSIARTNDDTDDKSNEKFHDNIARKMTTTQIKKAEAMVKELAQNNPKLIQKK